MSLHDPATVHLTIAVTGFVVVIAMISLTIYFAERNHRELCHTTIHGILEMQRNSRELKRSVDESLREHREGIAEIKRLQIVVGGMVYQEDEKTRALITARFDEMLRRPPR